MTANGAHLERLHTSKAENGSLDKRPICVFRDCIYLFIHYLCRPSKNHIGCELVLYLTAARVLNAFLYFIRLSHQFGSNIPRNRPAHYHASEAVSKLQHSIAIRLCIHFSTKLIRTNRFCYAKLYCLSF